MSCSSNWAKVVLDVAHARSADTRRSSRSSVSKFTASEIRFPHPLRDVDTHFSLSKFGRWPWVCLYCDEQQMQIYRSLSGSRWRFKIFAPSTFPRAVYLRYWYCSHRVQFGRVDQDASWDSVPAGDKNFCCKTQCALTPFPMQKFSAASCVKLHGSQQHCKGKLNPLLTPDRCRKPTFSSLNFVFTRDTFQLSITWCPSQVRRVSAPTCVLVILSFVRMFDGPEAQNFRRKRIYLNKPRKTPTAIAG